MSEKCAVFLNVKTGGTYSYHLALKGNAVEDMCLQCEDKYSYITLQIYFFRIFDWIYLCLVHVINIMVFVLLC
jgi:hypothetical protein